jgi:hypothetical protein
LLSKAGKVPINHAAEAKNLWNLFDKRIGAPPDIGEVKDEQQARRALRLMEDALTALLRSDEPTPSEPPAAPPAGTTPYSALLAYAAEKPLKGDELRAVKVLCDNNGSLALADFAVAMGWDCFNNGRWSSLQQRLKQKLRKQGWLIERRDNHARLRTHEVTDHPAAGRSCSLAACL